MYLEVLHVVTVAKDVQVNVLASNTASALDTETSGYLSVLIEILIRL